MSLIENTLQVSPVFFSLFEFHIQWLALPVTILFPVTSHHIPLLWDEVCTLFPSGPFSEVPGLCSLAPEVSVSAPADLQRTHSCWAQLLAHSYRVGAHFQSHREGLCGTFYSHGRFFLMRFLLSHRLLHLHTVIRWVAHGGGW